MRSLRSRQRIIVTSFEERDFEETMQVTLFPTYTEPHEMSVNLVLQSSVNLTVWRLIDNLRFIRYKNSRLNR